MNTCEISAKVEDRGQVRVAGVPFAPGTEVGMTIRVRLGDGWSGSPAKVEEPRARAGEDAGGDVCATAIFCARAGTKHRIRWAVASRGTL
jgi:hypothetical protein